MIAEENGCDVLWRGRDLAAILGSGLGSLVAQAFDAGRLEVRGEARSLGVDLPPNTVVSGQRALYVMRADEPGSEELLLGSEARKPPVRVPLTADQ